MREFYLYYITNSFNVGDKIPSTNNYFWKLNKRSLPVIGEFLLFMLIGYKFVIMYVKD